MTLSTAEGDHNSIESLAGKKIISIDDVPQIDFAEMDESDAENQLRNETIKIISRCPSGGVSASKVFTTTSTVKQPGKRPQSVRSSFVHRHLQKSSHRRALPVVLSKIPLPIKSSDTIKISSLLMKTLKRRCNSKTSSYTMSCSSTFSNKHILQIKFINTNKSYLQLKELIKNEKPIADLYRSLVEAKKKLEELSKLVVLEDIKLVTFAEHNRPPFEFEGAGEEVPVKVLHEMRSSEGEIPKTLAEVCHNLLNKRALIVELLDKVIKCEVDIRDVASRIESLKSEGRQLQESLERVLAEHKRKIEALMTNWESLLLVQKSSNSASDLALKLKEQEVVIQEANHVIADLRQKLDENIIIQDRAVAELNGDITSLRGQIKKLEQNIERERQARTDEKSRTSLGVKNDKMICEKKTDVESENTESFNTEYESKIKLLQQTLIDKESQWKTDKEKMIRMLKMQKRMLEKLNADENEFATPLETMEEQKLATEEETQKIIGTLSEQLLDTKTELEDMAKEWDAAIKQCAIVEDFPTGPDSGYKQEMPDIFSNVESGEMLNNNSEGIAGDVRKQKFADKLQAPVEEYEDDSQSSNSLNPTDCTRLSTPKELTNRCKMLLENNGDKLRSRTREVAKLQMEIRHLQIRQQTLEGQNNTFPTDEVEKIIEEGSRKLNGLVKQSVESEQKLEHYANFIRRQARQMGVLNVSRYELILENKRLSKYSVEMRTTLGEVAKEGKMKDRFIKELQDKNDLKDRQRIELDKQVGELETRLKLANEKRLKLQDAVGSIEKELKNAKIFIRPF
ncbi:putative leucine-rich repeat-containing protein DDB_G0290503 [Euwallacea fornicatus]|uniref:putative leucine-rich repeat-containing protein DDB_G0290503 n=1 Tax=Euwallacea fornicatus TaxID=995702 RepID=UPI00338E3763